MSYMKNRFGVMKAIMILVASFLIGLFPTEKAIACSCVAPGTPEEELKNSAAVFMGTVTSIEQLNISNSKWNLLGPFRHSLKIGVDVGHSWKGVTTDSVYVSTGSGAGDCGFPATASETYLFYAWGPVDDLNISVCSRTSLYREAQEDREYLEQLPELPLTQVVSASYASEDREQAINRLLAGTTIVLLGVVSYWLVKNRQRKKKHNQ